MSRTNVMVDLENIQSPAALQVYLGFVLDAGEEYGENLDALYDILTERVSPLHFMFQMGNGLSTEMEMYYPRLIRVLTDAAEDNRGITWEEVRKQSGIK